MGNATDGCNEAWVDEKLSDLRAAPAGWVPNVERGAALLRGRRQESERNRRTVWTVVAASAFCVALLALPQVRTLTQSLWGTAPLPSAETVSSAPKASPAAVFEGQDLLSRPRDYREWVFIGSSLVPEFDHASKGSSAGTRFENIYIDPAAYRSYMSNGRFPEGTVLVLEQARAERSSGSVGAFQKDFVSLEVSVKDSSRFEDGWGYFSFNDASNPSGQLASSAKARPEEACASCHQAAGEDHVFTQFYPVLNTEQASIPHVLFGCRRG